MDMVKKIWAFSFTVQKKNTTSLVVNLIVWVLAAVIAGLLIGLAGWIGGLLPDFLGGLIGWVLRIIGTIVDVYCVIGVVLSVLNYCDLLKETKN